MPDNLNNPVSLSLKDVWLKYRIEFKEEGKSTKEDFWALKGISLEARKGEVLGIIGENGAGKTTLLKVISGMLKQDSGQVIVNGSVSTLLEIGAGFQRELTGRENVYLICSLFGLSRQETDSRYHDIVRFADIGRFINAAVKYYSQGMYMRLAFAIAIHVEPQILLVDDIFSVGDLYAQRKCIEKMFELKEKKKTIILVTHDLEMAKRFCDRIILINEGEFIKEGEPNEVAAYYFKSVGDKRGIGAIRSGELEAIFNNGRLILNHAKGVLTAQDGASLGISRGAERYFSVKGDWQIEDIDEQGLLAKGRLWDAPLSVIWKMSFDSKGELGIELKIESEDNAPLTAGNFSLALSEAYEAWFSSNCPEPVSFSSPQDNPAGGRLDLKAQDCGLVGLASLKEEGVPAVFIKDNLYMPGKSLKVYDCQGPVKHRVLESSAFSNQGLLSAQGVFFHVIIVVMPGSRAVKDYCPGVCPECSLFIESRGVKLVASERMADIYWWGRKVTSSKGFKAIFYSGERDFQSSDAFWVLHKTSERDMEVFLLWQDSGIIQKWLFNIDESAVLRWEVSLFTPQKTNIENEEFSIMFSSAYKERFEGRLIQHSIPAEDSGIFEDTLMINDPGGMIELKEALSLPRLRVLDKNPSPRFNSCIHKTDSNVSSTSSGESRCVVTNICFRNKSVPVKEGLPAGVYSQSRLEVVFGGGNAGPHSIAEALNSFIPKRFFLISEKKKHRFVLRNQGYDFVFERGIGRLFQGKTELTRSLGFYSSLCSSMYSRQQWYVSADALWDPVDSDKNRITLRGSWPVLPIEQTWQVSSGEDGFNIKIDMQVFASAVLQKQQVNLMLCKEYADWRVEGLSNGSFPEDFALCHCDRFYNGKGGNGLSAQAREKSKGAYPELTFVCLNEKDNFEAIIENSNSGMRSRILGFEGVIPPEKSNYKPGICKFFQGKIKFMDKSRD